MKLFKYTFSDGTWIVAETIENAIKMQASQGLSTRVIKREEYKGL